MRYKNYLLSLLAVILAFNYVDRIALGIVLEDIKLDLDLTDTELGLLTGIAFALFYSVMGIPIARWADRGNRASIITITTAVWSGAVALCGAATSFAQLLLIRVGVAVGEAGCIPPAHSLIADYFARAERPRAISRYMLGSSLALVVGYFGAGWLNELYGWRTTFVIIGLPGVLLAAIAGLTVKEPRRAKSAVTASVASSSNSVPSSEPTLKEVCTTLWGSAAFRHLLLGFAVWFLFGYGVLQWQPAFFIRSYGLQTGELGMWFALVIGVSNGLGIFLGGELATRYAAADERLQLKVCSVAFAAFAILKICAYLAPNHYLAFGILALASLGGNMAQGPVYAAIQTLVPSRMRAMAIALVYLFSNLIGMGFGPLAVGAASDALRPWYGDESLRYALVLLSPGYLWAAWHLWRASQTVMSDLKATQAENFRGDSLAHTAGARTRSG